MLNTYSRHIVSLSDIDHGQPQRHLMETAIQMFGSPDRSHWRECNDTVLPWAKQVYCDQRLYEPIPSGGGDALCLEKIHQRHSSHTSACTKQHGLDRVERHHHD